MGRPRIILDPNQIGMLAAGGYTTPEIAALLECSEDTLERRFAGTLKKGRLVRDGSLRFGQMKLALAGNVTMLIWLGKNLLGQSDAKKDIQPARDPEQEAEPTITLTAETEDELRRALTRAIAAGMQKMAAQQEGQIQ
jgi:hypothetical protein